MSMQTIPFRPMPASTVNIDVAATTAPVSLGVAGRTNIRLMNDGTATVWVAFGVSGVTASLTTSMPVGPGVTEVITIEDYGATAYAAAIAAGATGKIYFTPGVGF